MSSNGSTWESHVLEKREQKFSVLVTEQERGNFLQEERGKETVLEGGWVREKPKAWEDNLMAPPGLKKGLISNQWHHQS